MHWTVSGSGHLSQTDDTTDGAGLSSVTWTFDSLAADAQTAFATVAGLVGSPVVFSGTANAGTAVKIASNTGDFQAGPVGGALPVSVVVTDGFGNGKSGVSVSWAAVGGGSVSGTTSQSTANGIATVSRNLGAIAGAYGTTATVAGLTGSPVTFSDTAAALEQIQVGNNFFNPVHDTIPAGTFLQFHWSPGGVLHSVVWLTGPMPLPDNSGAAQTTGDFFVRVAKAGSYTYECGVHGAAMPGAIVAQ